MNVLVIPSGTEIGCEIIRSLTNVKGVTVFGANSIECFSSIPEHRLALDISYVNDESFIEDVATLITKFGVTHIFPAHDSAALKLTKYAASLDAKVVSSSYQTNRICRSKSETYRALKSVVKIPRVYTSKSRNIPLPLFSKPDVGQGSVGAKIVSQIEDDTFEPSKIVTEYLPGREFTVDCVTDSEGQMIFAKARAREEIKNGIAVKTSLVEDQGAFLEMAEKISKALSLRGAWFFQVKEDTSGVLTLLEVSTRVAGSMIVNRFNGVNFAELSLLISNGTPVSVLDNGLPVILYRNLDVNIQTSLEFDEVFIDYDDCLLLRESLVNIELVKFIYQCRNLGKTLTLITRHSGNLANSLKQYRLDSLFDNVIHITDRKVKKSEFIVGKKAIFIDDSYSEREDVAKVTKVPCFSVDAIAMLNSAVSRLV